MRFNMWYNIYEKWDSTFRDRDFGDGIANIVELPEGILQDGSRIETYVHGKGTVHTFVFDSKNVPTHFITGTLENPIEDITYADSFDNITRIKYVHPTNEKSPANYSGVEPIKPPFKGYNGPYHIPSEFNMKDFNTPGSVKGVRSSTDWKLN